MKIRSVLMVAVAVALISGWSTQGIAQTVPHKASGSDATYVPGTGAYFGEGNGTHLGKHVIDGFVIPDGEFFPEEGVFFRGTFTGAQTAIAADGSTITATLEGEVELVFNADGAVEGLWFPAFEVTGGTGRFDGVSGAWEGVAINPPFDPSLSEWPFDWSVIGTVDLNN